MATERQLQERGSRESYWGPELARWRASGLSATEYCRQNKLKLHTFKYWQYRLKFRLESKSASEPELFSEITPLVQTRQSSRSSESSGLELITTANYRIAISRSFDSSTLRQLLQALEESSC